jgi:hypothetical protein
MNRRGLFKLLAMATAAAAMQCFDLKVTKEAPKMNFNWSYLQECLWLRA